MNHDCDKCQGKGKCENESTIRELKELVKAGKTSPMVLWFLSYAEKLQVPELFKYYEMSCDVGGGVGPEFLKEYVRAVTQHMRSKLRKDEDDAMRKCYYQNTMNNLMESMHETQMALSEVMDVQDMRMKLARDLAEAMRTGDDSSEPKSTLH